MKKKQTLYDWLTTRHQFIIRDEENFADKRVYSFNYALLLTLISGLIFIIVALAFTIYTTLNALFFGNQSDFEQKKQLIDLSMKVDSLMGEMDKKQRYDQNIRMILSGNSDSLDRIGISIPNDSNKSMATFSDDSKRTDSLFQQNFESSTRTSFSSKIDNNQDDDGIYFMNPIEGLMTDKFNPKKNHFGVDIVAPKNEPIKAAASGTVIFSSWTQDSGYVLGIQHSGNYVTIYKHNSELLKTTGNFVQSGEIIAVIGNTGEFSTGPHLHFELWYSGNPVNPEEFLTFK